jgi:hypothetical protein
MSCVHFDRGILSQSLAAVIGVVFLVIVVFLFLYSICTPFSRRILLGRQTACCGCVPFINSREVRELILGQ